MEDEHLGEELRGRLQDEGPHQQRDRPPRHEHHAGMSPPGGQGGRDSSAAKSQMPPSTFTEMATPKNTPARTHRGSSRPERGPRATHSPPPGRRG